MKKILLYLYTTTFLVSCNLINKNNLEGKQIKEEAVLYMLKDLSMIKPGEIINDKNEINPNFKIVKSLNFENSERYISLLEDKSCYGEMPLSCYSPQYVLILYKKNRIEQIVNIDFACNRVIGKPKFKGYEFFDVGAGTCLSDYGKKITVDFLREEGIEVYFDNN